ncbi:RNA polymerase factor sigma-54 [Oceanobacillus sp. CAU 1775]
MKQGIIQHQTLERKINQTLIQSLQLLQFTSTELHHYLNHIAEENPLIEDIIFNYEEKPTTYHRSETVSLEETNASEKNLYDVLLDQILTMNLSPDLKKITEYGIYSLDEAGYLDITLEDWAENCAVDIPQVEESLKVIQQLEPFGVGARSLGECLLLQVRQMKGYHDYMDDLLLYHLEWLAENEFEAIKDTYNIEENEVAELFQMIQGCNPKPGQLLTTSPTEYIIPEANIYKDEAEWHIVFHHLSIPKIIYSKPALEQVDRETKDYLKEKTQQIDGIKRALKYRASTLELVLKEITDKQQAFFENGIIGLVPLKLSDVANKVGLHLSTISRAISNKHIQTPHGVYPIKFFFQHGIKQKDGSIATIIIKDLIKQIISQENKDKPLSDEKIRLELEGSYSLKVARRTVMKYREQLNIPSSLKRRQQI